MNLYFCTIARDSAFLFFKSYLSKITVIKNIRVDQKDFSDSRAVCNEIILRNSTCFIAFHVPLSKGGTPREATIIK